jgi:hypothetical protein
MVPTAIDREGEFLEVVCQYNQERERFCSTTVTTC